MVDHVYSIRGDAKLHQTLKEKGLKLKPEFHGIFLGFEQIMKDFQLNPNDYFSKRQIALINIFETHKKADLNPGDDD